MMRKGFVIFLVSCSLSLVAQDSALHSEKRLCQIKAITVSLVDREMESLRLSRPWLSSENGAGLVCIPNYNITYAEVFFNKRDGKFINYFSSDNSYRIGAVSESYFRLKSSVGLYGKVDYSNFYGLRMGGSAFIEPYCNTFDIVELTDDNRGSKRLETYHLTGGIGVSLGKRWALGGKVDYKAANYAKFKDLRHKNDLFDIRASVGVRFKTDGLLDFGLAYLFRRSVESLSFKSYGNTDAQFTSLVSFGAFYGRSELFGDNGYTDQNTVNPMVNSFQGGAVQVNVGNGGEFSFFNEFSYQFRDGYFGKRSTTSPVLTEHKGTLASYNGVANLKGISLTHSLQVGFSRESLDNFENIYRKETTQGGRNEIVYFGNNKVLHRNVTAVNAYYTMYVGRFAPDWTFGIGGDLWQRRQTVSLYPYYRKQSIHQWIAKLNAERSFWLVASHKLTVALDAGYGSGSGTAKNDGVYATPSTGENPPKESEINLRREFEYLTAQHVSCAVGCRYAFIFPTPNKLDNIYIKAYYQTDRALNGMFKNKYFDGINLSVGCNW